MKILFVTAILTIALRCFVKIQFNKLLKSWNENLTES